MLPKEKEVHERNKIHFLRNSKELSTLYAGQFIIICRDEVTACGRYMSEVPKILGQKYGKDQEKASVFFVYMMKPLAIAAY
jgi:hypothetical protein